MTRLTNPRPCSCCGTLATTRKQAKDWAALCDRFLDFVGWGDPPASRLLCPQCRVALAEVAVATFEGMKAYLR